MLHHESRLKVAVWVVGAIVVALGLLWSFGEYRALENRLDLKAELESIDALRALTLEENDFVEGDPTARVVVVEYADLECPYCKQFNEEWSYSKSRIAEKGVAFVFKHFPLDYLHTQAVDEAIALECAGILKGPGGFFPYRDMIYANTEGEDTLDLALLPKFAEVLGIDAEDFSTCRSGSEAVGRVSEDIVSGAILGVYSTPSFALYKDGAFQYTITSGSAIGWRNLEVAIESLLAE